VLLLALGAILAVALTGSGAKHGARGGTTNTTHRTTAPSTTTPTTTTAATTTAATTTAPPPPPPPTPQQLIASTRAAVIQAQTSGQLDPGAAKDLDHRIDDIEKALGKDNAQDAAHKVADTLHHLDDLAGHGGQLTPAGLAQISAPLNQLAALLPSTPPPGKH
jgi:hypothetical protein